MARFSGEEFVLLLPELSDSNAFNVIQAIQNQVSKLPFKFRDRNLTITLSAASTAFKDSDTPEEILERLNLCLNEAKTLGKNQLVWR